MATKDIITKITDVLFRRIPGASSVAPRLRIMEMNNGVSVSLLNGAWFFENDPAIEFLRGSAGMRGRGFEGRRTRNFLRRTVRAAGRRANL